MWESIYTKLRKMPKDKVYHLGAGFVVSLLLSFIHPVFGIAMSGVAGVGKEIYDQYSYGVFDKKDVLFTLAGGIVAAMIYQVGWYFVSG